jgi:hypothetical protein
VRGVGPLRKLDVLASWTFRSLAAVERDRLALAELVKRGLTAGRAVEEVLISIARQDEPESFIAHKTFNRSGQRCHLPSSNRVASIRSAIFGNQAPRFVSWSTSEAERA